MEEMDEEIEEIDLNERAIDTSLHLKGLKIPPTLDAPISSKRQRITEENHSDSDCNLIESSHEELQTNRQ